MENNEILQKTLEYNKAGFEQIYSAVAKLQEQTEQLTEKSLESAGFMPEEGKALLRKCIETSKEALENTKEVVAKGHEQIEKFIEAI